MKATYTVENFGEIREIRLKGDWTRAARNDIPREGIDRLCLNPMFGWRTSGDLSFLSLLDPVRHLRIYWLNKIDLYPLTTLTDLRELQLHLYAKLKIPFDFGDLPSLRSLNFWWNRGFTGLQRMPHIERLSVYQVFGASELDFSGLTTLRSLEVVTGRGVKSIRLNGIRHLEELTLIGLSNLQQVRGFESGSSVRSLRIEGLKKVDLSFLRKFMSLETVTTRARDPFEKSSFGRPPKNLVKFPI
jgi:hypothetical protein